MQEKEAAPVNSSPGAEIPLMTEERLASGVQVARTAGDLWAASDIVALMEMPILAGFLESRGERLQRVAADVLQRAGQAGALAPAQDAERARLSSLRSREIAEEVARRVAAESAAERIEEVALAGAGFVPDELGESPHSDSKNQYITKGE